MKKIGIISAFISLTICSVWLSQCTNGIEGSKQNTAILPKDALDISPLTQQDFASWFTGDSIAENGEVNPANSLTFTAHNNSDFYKWSYQMFLWLTSPKNSGTVMESGTFFTVSPLDDGTRELIPHTVGSVLKATTHLKKVSRKRFRKAGKSKSEIDSEELQATGDGLMSKNGSLFYYITMVNDVYVQFLKSYGNNTDVAFPTTPTNLDSIKKRSQQNLPNDSIALAIELKTSWVTAKSLGRDSVNYIIVSAEIPTYDTTNNQQWIENGSTITRLALAGMHIVGSANGHPEMIWATFEQVSNAPNATYPYLDSSKAVKWVQQDGGQNWLLSNNGSDQNPNISHIRNTGNTLKADSMGNVLTISPSNSLRINPFGCFTFNTRPNPQDDPAASNSRVIALNNSIEKMLVGSDIRKNYMLIGATWTGKGKAPNGNSFIALSDTVKGGDSSLAVGTSQLANSTMETYVMPVNYQDPGNGFNLNMSCFACHSESSTDSATLYPRDLSHIFKHIKISSTEPIQTNKQSNK